MTIAPLRRRELRLGGDAHPHRADEVHVEHAAKFVDLELVALRRMPAQFTSASMRGQRSISAATEASSVTSSRTGSIIGSGRNAAISASPMPPATTRQPSRRERPRDRLADAARPAGDDGERGLRYRPAVRTSEAHFVAAAARLMPAERRRPSGRLCTDLRDRLPSLSEQIA